MSRRVLRQPFVFRLLHWLHTITLLALLLSGLYIHMPTRALGFANMLTAKKVHSVLAFIFTYAFIVRVYAGLATRTIRRNLFVWSDLRLLPALLKYYLFLSRHRPQQGKYNAGQRLEMTGWALLIPWQALTGFTLYSPGRLAWSVRLHGSLTNVRVIHFYLALVFGLTTMLHLYLALTGEKEKFKAMFTGYVRKED